MLRKFSLCLMVILLFSTFGLIGWADEPPAQDIPSKTITSLVKYAMLEKFPASFGIGLSYTIDGHSPVHLPVRALEASGETVLEWSGLPNDDGLQVEFHLYIMHQGKWVSPIPHVWEVKTEWLNELEVHLSYTIPFCKISLTAEKIWQGGPADKPDIWLQLYQQAPGKPGVAMGSEPVKLSNGETSYTWHDLPKWACLFKPYIYFVKEVDAKGDDFTPENYAKLEDGLTVSNIYVPPTGPITAYKKWRHGPAVKPEIYFQLYLEDQPVGTPQKVDPETNQVVWPDLALTDEQGQELVYHVVEVDAEGNDFVPLNYTKQEDGLIVTNTYVPPRGPITAHKKWLHGPAVKPEIYFQLYLGEQVVGTPQKVDPETNQVVWTDLALTDDHGQELIYRVTEVDAKGNDFVPANYTKQEDGLVVTNTFVPPVRSITAAKIWLGGDYKNRPVIELQLMRDGQPLGQAVELDGKLSHTWADMPLTDLTGQPYVYTVDEVAVPEGYEKTVLGLIVTNRYVASNKPADPKKPITPVVPKPPASGGTATPRATLPKTGVGPSLLPWIILCLGSARFLLKKD